ncbi:hypothetical protein FSP39_006806 [Pinctada imbricata]|uniref:Phospholipid/glycerol acyltransferase domain-containing protein n=1 Tax=Pinctada imbricata TaxID=66713 RepID=A0AA88YAL1_PINIB|nr:hypothetical protein FSP39_006806 [Pinctada imbricata]
MHRMQHLTYFFHLSDFALKANIEQSIPALYETLCGVRVTLTGDPVSPEDATLIIMNHRTRFDWLFIFSYIIRCGPLRRFKISLKEVLKNVPGPGWAMQCAGYIFLHRKWESDQKTILRCLTYFRKLNYKPQILLFPEGTDLTPNTKARSDKFAEKMGLEKYDYVLHPRTTGFAFLVQKMRDIISLDSILDVTIAYPKNIPQTEKDILNGNFPTEVHFYIHGHSAKEVPDDKEGIEEWCQKRWKDKENLLENYYTDGKKFKASPVRKELCKDEKEIQKLFVFAHIFWTIFQALVIVFMIYAPILRWFSLFSCITFVLISKYGGIDALLDTEASELR